MPALWANSLFFNQRIRLIFGRTADIVRYLPRAWPCRVASVVFDPRLDRGPHTAGRFMKMIIAIIKPFKLEDVRDALTSTGIQGMTIAEVKGYGRQKGHKEIYRGAEYAVNFLPKIRLDVAVDDNQVDKVIEVIANAAKTGQIGDGKIFVTGIDSAVRIRTGETDSDAL